MDIRLVILASLSAGAAGCCSEEGIDFAVDEGVTQEDVEGSDWYSADLSDEEICRELCESFVAVNDNGHSVVVDAIDSCTLEHLEESDEGSRVVCEGSATETTCAPAGRRPLGHVEVVLPGRDLGERLARDAHLEAASVVAFLQLARQLSGLGAPAELIGRCRQAAAEEVVHSRILGQLARDLGASVASPRRASAEESLAAIALHNAVEGCVLEAWAAVVAGHQAVHAAAPALRRAYTRIAADEAGHAQLAWDLHAWLLARLSPAQRAQVEQAQEEALNGLPALAAAQAAEAPAGLGLPSPAVAAAMAARFRGAIAA